MPQNDLTEEFLIIIPLSTSRRVKNFFIIPKFYSNGLIHVKPCLTCNKVLFAYYKHSDINKNGDASTLD